MEQFINIPDNYIQLFLVVGFSLVIGLSQRKMQLKSDEQEPFFGSDRTFTLIGILGYILYIIDPATKVFWGCGGAGLMVLFAVNYHFKLSHVHRYGITSIITACITYCIPTLVMTQPLQFSLLVLVIVLLLTEMKETFISVTSRMNNDEFMTLAKFLIIAGIILPILPNERIFADINLTPRNIWSATVVISGMSYFSYLLQKFVFRGSGLLVSGILGGLYSSTATTIILSRKSKKAPEFLLHRYSGAIILASAMMVIRVLVMLIIFNTPLFLQTWHYFAILFVISMAAGLLVYFYKTPTAEQLQHEEKIEDDQNPLEFKVALIFAALFILFTLVTYYTVLNFGAQGLTILSFLVGITDITPFITNLFQGDYFASGTLVVSATFIAMFSNNIMKLGYALTLGTKSNRKSLIIAFAVMGATALVLLMFM
ncbi:MAG: DUF4010 domain-containing protein [Prevotellaceae bacterium]|jgi:uncharacterized membrane protein (DUF4010 family)|nr:DUF4010 domain-containing protein [Prevotellaceae bacterium]